MATGHNDHLHEIFPTGNAIDAVTRDSNIVRTVLSHRRRVGLKRGSESQGEGWEAKKTAQGQ